MFSYAGEIAALLTALCWSMNSLFFSSAGKRVGSSTVNLLRLWIALAILVPVHTVLTGIPIPWRASPTAWLSLSLSGMIGFVLGDAAYLEALVLLGPRLVMLLMTTSPFVAALLGWLISGETLGRWEICAMIVTLAGVAWVVGEGNGGGDAKRGTGFRKGILFGLLGAVGQAVGLLFPKMGLKTGISPMSANLIRIAAAGALMTGIVLLTGRFAYYRGKFKEKQALRMIALGTLLGPLTGVILSLYSVKLAPLGVASTLMSLSPVILIPISRFVLHEKISLRAVVGTILSLLGVALFFLAPLLSS